MASGIATGLSGYSTPPNYPATTNSLMRSVAVHRASVGKESRGRSGEEPQVIVTGALSLEMVSC